MSPNSLYCLPEEKNPMSNRSRFVLRDWVNMGTKIEEWSSGLKIPKMVARVSGVISYANS